MFEVGRAVTECQFGGHAEVFGYFFLESGDICVAFGIQFAVLQVEQGGAGEFCGGEALVVCRCSLKFGYEFVRNDFAGQIVLGVDFEKFGFESPVFMDL